MKHGRILTTKWFLRCLLVLSLVLPFSASLPPLQIQAAGSVIPMVAAGGGHTVGLRADGTVMAIGNNDYGQLNVGSWTDFQQVAAGFGHTVGLKADGTVVAVGDNSCGQLNVESWTGIQQVAGGDFHTVGLKADGTVVAVGNNDYGQLNVGSWTNITQITAGMACTLGVKADGTVVAVGNNIDGQLNVGSWTDIVQVAAGYTHTVGLKADGTVVAVGYNNFGQLDVGSWIDIKQISVGIGAWNTIGLKADGTVVAVGNNDYGQLNVGSWTGIQQVAAGAMHTVGLKSDGTVVATGDNSHGQSFGGSWENIQQIAAGAGHTVGLKDDGTVAATGWNDDGQLNVGSWSDIQQVVAGAMHTVGLKADGTVVAVGNNDDGQLNVGSWSDIQQVAAGFGHTVGLKADGTVVAVGNNDHGQLDVGSWTGIQQVATGGMYTVGLKADGTVVMVGAIILMGIFTPPPVWTPEFQLSILLFQQNVESWTDLQQVAGGPIHAVGLKVDGTVMTAGYDSDGQMNVGSWTDIQRVAAGAYHTLGLKADGTLVAVGNNDYGQLNAGSWTDIQQVAAGFMHTVGLKADGTVVAVGYNNCGQLNVDVEEEWFLGFPNKPPVADAGGPYTVDEGTSLTLDASGSSDPDDDIILYEWDLDNDGQYDDAVGETTTLVFNDNGIYAVRLKVTDSYGEYDTDTTTVTVSDLGPTSGFSWSPEPQNEGASVTFTDMSVSTPDAIVAWDWDFGGFGSSTNQNPIFTFTDNGIYNVTLTVTDEDGSTDTISHVVTVRDLGPTAVLSGDTELDESQTGSYDASGSTSSPDAIVSYEWDWDYDGSTFNPSGDTGAVQSHAWSDDGTYIIAVKVTDKDGSMDTVSHVVTILDLGPTAVLTGDTELNERQAGNYDASGSTSSPDSIVSYEWDWDYNGVTFNPSGENGAIQIHAWNDDGTCTVAVRVTDDDGSTDIATLFVTVNNLPPVIMVENLSEDIEAMEDLPASIKNSLTTSLDKANKVLEDSNPKNDVAAINVLKALINKIEAQRGKKIPEGIASDLIAKAQEIIEALSEGT